ncbi:hypothetical protein [Nostoc sp. PCC 9305]|uniref:hypothetical protein n=1 Tax=Nostoc sp. PCC 9305 TaxID=296636 RepID=UPI0039C70381
MLLTHFRPLPARDPAYVDFTEVRGDGDILVSCSTFKLHNYGGQDAHPTRVI